MVYLFSNLVWSLSSNVLEDFCIPNLGFGQLTLENVLNVPMDGMFTMAAVTNTIHGQLIGFKLILSAAV